MRFPLRVKAVTIDLDGTLADTIPDLAAAANKCWASWAVPRSTWTGSALSSARASPRLVERTLADSFGPAVSADLMARALPLYERFYAEVNGSHTEVYPGVSEGLRALRDMQLPLACVTNKSGRFTAPLLEHLDLARYFEQVIAGDTLPQKKPDPAQLLHACSGFGIAPREMLMIGDSVNDAEAARAAGCPVFCVTYGYNEGRDVRELDVDAIVPSLIEAARLIQKA